MLHLGKDEQKNRLSERLDGADKYWKYDPGDLDERRFWDEYMEAYQVMLDQTSTDDGTVVRGAGEQEVVRPDCRAGASAAGAGSPRPAVATGHFDVDAEKPGYRS